MKVLDDITIGLLDPKLLTIVTQESHFISLSWLRSTMENIALSSIMKLDNDSMNKLFDLMTMMVKYQLTAATGPREIILITLNHIDSFREIISTTNAHQCVTLIHEMIINFYSKFTYNEIWQSRNDCLNELSSINVRVSILLKLGIQNEDTTFNLTMNNYNEKFIERQSELGDLKLLDHTCRGYNVGSLQLFGDRVTLLGRNIYSSNLNNVIKTSRCNFENHEKLSKNQEMKTELGMLAVQLGTNEESSAISRPFSLNLFINDAEINLNTNDELNLDKNLAVSENETVKDSDEIKSNKNYRDKLNKVCGDFIGNDIDNGQLNLLQLLDEAE
ncbi:hypothetical protein PV326_004439 [Microctonus aethiopoides]|nr:hypothetical protein PV326_004439 [Microctonus aethiopoides]